MQKGSNVPQFWAKKRIFAYAMIAIGFIVPMVLVGSLFALSAGATDFTIVALPDTQHYTDDPNHYSNYFSQTQWIVDNRLPLNIAFVTHLGDIVEHGNNGGDNTEWLVADAAMALLENPVTTTLTDGIPFGVIPGNKDKGNIGGIYTYKTAAFNDFFGVERFLGRAYYGGYYDTTPLDTTDDKNDNNFELFSAGGLDFIIIHLEYDTSPSASVLNWADNLLQTYSNRRAIVTTHSMIGTGNPGSFSSQGQAIYDALRDNPNLFLMLGGHVAGEGQREDKDLVTCHTIYSLLSDYQSRSNGGNGWLRIMEFSPANNEIRVKTYTPVLDQFETDADSQFTLEYDMTGIPNRPPEAIDDSDNTPEETLKNIDVAANDDDPECNMDLTTTNTVCTTCSEPANGTLLNNGDGTFDYTPALNFIGDDTFVYEICDTDGLCDTAAVTITVNPINEQPTAVDDNPPSTDEDTPLLNINVAFNDADPDNNLDVSSTNATCATCSGPVNGMLVNNGNGTFDYTPDPNFNGGDFFIYEICDSGVPSLCDTAMVTITVNSVPDPPDAIDDPASTVVDTLLPIDVVANDSDPENNLDPTSANVTCANGSTGCHGTTNGILTNNGNGTFDYSPSLNFKGTDTFVYEICDTGLLCSTATVTISVVNDPPVAMDDSDSTLEDTSKVIDVAFNDSDPDNNLNKNSSNTACGACSEPNNGSLGNNGIGTFEYTPDLNFNGGDTFVYEICDSGGLCDTAKVTITVTPVADPPVANDDPINTPQDMPVTFNVTANDTDPDSNLDPNTVVEINPISHGNLINKGAGLFTYTPDLDFVGADSFVYEICDTDLLCDTATVTIVVGELEIFLPLIIRN